MPLWPATSEPDLANVPDAGRLAVVIDILQDILAASGGSTSVDPLGYGQEDDLSAAVGLPGLPGSATYAVVTIETQGVRWRDDGTNPTASVGMPIAAGQSYVFKGSNAALAALKFIEVTSGAVLNVAYYG